ncbi:hypothetical protein POP12_119 [Pectobacterium phage POP12]|nr:hypothetical protein POP12_119 [Pectobacterium phage POP12]
MGTSKREDDMKLKNDKTEEMANNITEIYFSDGYPAAMKEFNVWLETNKLSKIEYIIVVERIKELILIKKGNKP